MLKIEENINRENEIWVPIKFFEGIYEISNLGRVKCLGIAHKLWHGGMCVRKSKILKPSMRSGYYIIVLSKNNIRTTHSIHRLLAIHFIPNPENKKQVNHINGVRSDYRLSNLEWCTPSENVRHSYKVLKRKGSNTTKGKLRTSVIQVSLDGFLLNEFDSFKKASETLGIKRHQIGLCVNNKIKSAGGYIWI